MAAGKRDTPIAIERYHNDNTDDLGHVVPDWRVIGQYRAQVFWGRGDEQRAAAQTSGMQAATFRVVACETTRGLNVTDRIVYAGAPWDIRSIVPVGRADIDITAVRKT